MKSPDHPIRAVLPRVPQLILAVAALSAGLGLSAQTEPSAPDATPADGAVVKMSPFRVDRSRDHGYSTANEIGASRVNIPLANVPGSAVVLNEEFLKDVGALTTNDAFRYVSGVNASNLVYNGQVALRGFQAGDGIGYVDGLPANISLNGAAMNDFVNIERVEIIKGPNGVLYGSHTPGGVIDMITKKPLFRPFAELTLVAGSWDLLRESLDVSGPLGNGQKFAYRFVQMEQSGETYNHGVNDKRFLAPSFTWAIGGHTQLTASFEYYNPNVATSRSQWFSDRVGAISWFIPTSGYFDDQDEHREHWVYFSNVSLEHSFSDAWKLRVVGRNINVTENKLNYAHGTYRFLNQSGGALTNASGAAATAANYTFAEAFANPLFGDITVDRTRQLNVIKAFRRGLYADLVGDLHLLGMRHQPVLSLQATADSTDTKNTLWSYPRTSVLHPVYFDDSLAHVTSGPTVNTNNIAWNSTYNFGVQDNASAFGDALNIVLGVRRDHANQHSLNRLNNARVESINEQNSYRAGVLYKFVPYASVFGNWSQTFTPLNGFDALNQPLQNQVSTMREAGVKLDALDSRLTATFAVFDLKQDHATRTVVINPATGVTGALQVGYIRSRGWEGDAAYQVTKSITLLGGVGSTLSKDENGIASRGVSQGFNGKAFGKYTFIDGPAKGLAVGVGYLYNNRAPGDGNATFYLPDYGLFDAFVSYQIPHWRFQVNVQNLTDKEYAAGAVSGAYITSGIPREFRFTATYTY